MSDENENEDEAENQTGDEAEDQAEAEGQTDAVAEAGDQAGDQAEAEPEAPVEDAARLPQLNAMDDETAMAAAMAEEQQELSAPEHGGDLEAVYDIPVQVSAVLGRATMQVSQLLKLGRGAVVELDRKVGEAIDIYVNDRLVARGEVVVVNERLGVTMTEIVKSSQSR